MHSPSIFVNDGHLVVDLRGEVVCLHDQQVLRIQLNSS